MRLIDAHKVQLKLLEECQNIRHFDKDRKKPQIFADGLDFAWVMLDNQPTVKAIPIELYEQVKGERDVAIEQLKSLNIELFEKPYLKAITIEWLKQYASKKSYNDEMDCYWTFWEEDVLKMIEDWEKENGK